MNPVTFQIVNYLLGIVYLVVLLQGCTVPPKTLKPVAIQNQENIDKLSTNVRILLALYEPLLEASSNAMITQHIVKTEQEMIAVVGAATLPAPSADETWEMLFEQAARMSIIAKREKYFERYRFVRSAIERGVGEAELEKLKSSEGWIYQTVANAEFTPRKAHTILKTLATLKKINVSSNSNYFQRAEEQLLPYDPVLGTRRESVNNAYKLLGALKKDINLQLNSAHLLAQSIARFSRAEVKLPNILIGTEMEEEEIRTVLSQLGKKYLKNQEIEEIAINFLTGELSNFIKRLER